MSYVNRGSVLTIGVTFIPLSLVAVIARFGTRIHHGGLGIDDWLCLAASVLVWGACAIMIEGYTTHSLGTHTPPVGLEVFTWTNPSYQMVKKLEYALYCLLTPALVLMKLSILFFYRRLFRGKAFSIAFNILSVFSILWGIAFFTAFAAACHRLSDNWTTVQTLRTQCVDTFKLLFIQAILDVTVDLGILVLPIPFIFGLQMPLRRKIVISCTFVVGSLAIACGIARAVVYIELLSVPLFSKATIAGLRTDDLKGVVSALCMWSVLEMGVGIIAICLPTLRPLLNRRSLEHLVIGFSSLLGSSSSSKKSASIDLSERTLESGAGNKSFNVNNARNMASITSDHRGTTHMGDKGADKMVDGSGIMVERTFRLDTVPR